MTPITKNGNSEEIRAVRVLNADGEQIGRTYPKRARGLVKKGRARWSGSSELLEITMTADVSEQNNASSADERGRGIRLNVSDVTKITEENEMDNNIITQGDRDQVVNMLFFNAREWRFNKDCKDNTGSRSFMTGPDGTLSEAFTIGNWSWNWTEIVSPTLILPKNTAHSFVFWLNGGENDRNNEVCRFEVIFNNNWEGRYTYNLNRNFIRPLKKLNGWELYEIPFITGDNEYTELRFVAQYAYMTVMSAKEPAFYADLPDAVDEFEERRPQRHNIVFGDGWPLDRWYSTKKLREQAANEEHNSSKSHSRQTRDELFGSPKPLGKIADTLNAVNGTLSTVPEQVSGMVSKIVNSYDFVRQKITEAVINCGAENSDEIADMIMESFEEKFDGLSDHISEAIENMTDQIEGMMDSVEEALEEVQDSIEDIQDD